MTHPLDEPVPVPARSPWALWGAAHLAWGVAIFLALIYAAQQLPVESTVSLQRPAWVFYLLGIAWIALTGWQSIERGWRLRSPTSYAERLSLLEFFADTAVGLAMLAALLRADHSRLLTAGADRVVSTLVTVGILSALLWLVDRLALHHPERPSPAPAEKRLRWLRLILGICLVALAAWIEAQPQ